jgi:hypothetical protein
MHGDNGLYRVAPAREPSVSYPLVDLLNALFRHPDLDLHHE